MGEYKDVAKNSDILKIANAIRLVTGYEGDMTIEQMPRIILELGQASIAGALTEDY